MEIDLNVSSYLANQRVHAPMNLRSYFGKFEDLYERKLWHQLTIEVLKFIEEPEAGPLLISLFEQFIMD
jgi:26S proteasome regulatory subunit N9